MDFLLSTVRYVFLLLLCGGLSLLSVPPGFAQEAPPDTSDLLDQKVLFVSGGAAIANVGAVDLPLAAAGYPTFTSRVPSFGGGVSARVWDRLRVGVEGHAYVWGTGRGGTGRSVTLQGGYGLLTASYAVHPLPERLPNLRVAPSVGVGGGTLQLRVSAAADNFAAALESPAPGVVFRRWSPVVSADVTADYHVLGDTPFHFRVGLEGGYAAAPTASDWRVNGTRVTGGPDATLEGPFARLRLGRAW